MRERRIHADGSESVVLDGASYTILNDILRQEYSICVTVDSDSVDIRVLTEGTFAERHLTMPMALFNDIIDFVVSSKARLVGAEP